MRLNIPHAPNWLRRISSMLIGQVAVPRGCSRWNLVEICDVTNGVSMFILPMFLS